MSATESDPSPLLANLPPTSSNAPIPHIGVDWNQGWENSELPLIGRAVEVAEIKRLLGQSSPVTLTGLGGVGKSRVAAQVAQELAPTVQSVYWVDLAGINNLQEWEQAFAQALGIVLPPSQQGQSVVAAHLRNRTALLVLDSFEHLIDRVAWLAHLQTLLAAAMPRILITSRERLNIPNEVVVAMRGLSTQISDPKQPLTLSPAEELFLYHASKVQAGYVMTTDERQHAHHICTLVNGSPLAIELAAAWIPLFPTNFIAEQIQRNLDWLTTSVSLTHGPQKSMRAAIEYFWAQLSAHEQRCLRHLSVFHEGFDRELAQEITDASAFFLMALVDRALLVRQTSGRYVLHSMLRHFAEEQLNQDPAEANEIRQRHAHALFKLLGHASEAWLQQSDLSWLHRFDTEQANMQAAIQWAIKTNATDLAITMATQMSAFYQQLGYFTEGIRLIQAALALVPQPIEKDHFLAGLAQAELQLIIGEFATAASSIHQVLQSLPDTLPERNDLHSQAWTLLAEIETRQGNHLTAQRYAKEAMQIAQHAKSPTTLANAMSCESHIFRDTSNYAQAIHACQNALILHQRTHNQTGVAVVHIDLGMVYLLQKDIAAAMRAFHQAHAIYSQLGNRLQTVRALFCLGLAFYEQREFVTARANAEQALVVFKELAVQEYIVQAQLLLGNIALEQNQNPESYYLLGLDGALRVGLMPRMLGGLCGVARARMHNGRNTSAVELIGLLLSHAASNSAIVQEANTLLTQLRRLLSHKEVERHLASGQRRNLHQTVREMLLEGTIG